MRPLSWSGLLSLLVVSTAAQAQGAPEPEAAGEVGLSDGSQPPSSPPRRVPIQSHAEGWVWHEVLSTRAGMMDLAQDPQRPTTLLAVDLSGGVWRSDDGGRSWTATLDAAAQEVQNLDQEDLLLEAEATAQDFLDDQEVEEEGDFDDESELVDEFSVSADLVDLMVMREGVSPQGPSQRLGGVLWFHPERGGLALLSRADGLWRSNDSGMTWRKQSELSTATSFTLTPSGLLLAGTSDGVVYSRDLGGSWRPATGIPTGTRVRDLAVSAGLVLAATDEGLYLSGDGSAWAPASGFGEVRADLRALASDPRMEGGIWIATDNEVLRSDDVGQSLFALSGTPLPDTENLVLAGGGQLLAATSDGVWESVDGGVVWRPVSFGLPGPLTKDILAVADGLVVASADGIFLLKPEQQSQAHVAPELEGLPLNTVVGIAVTRPGLDPYSYGIRPGASWSQRLIPNLVVKGNLTDQSALAADFTTPTTGSNSAALQERWYVTAELRWEGFRSDYQSSGSGVADGGDAFYVVQGSVLSTTDPNAIPVAAANVQTAGLKYQQNLTRQVVDLYNARMKLVSERADLPPDDLRTQTLHELKILETTALLDAYTDGAYSAALQPAGPSQEGPTGETP